MRLATTLIFLLLATGIATPAQKPKKPEPCADVQTQGGLNVCWRNEYRAADARLNQAYREFAAKLNLEEKAQLQVAQTAWLKYRDTNCEFVADQFKGGTMRPMIAAICLTDVTDARTKELKAQMKERDQ